MMQTVADLNNGQLVGYHIRHGEFRLENLRKDEFLCRTSFIRKITVGRDNLGRITGLFVTNSRVRNLWLEKRD